VRRVEGRHGTVQVVAVAGVALLPHRCQVLAAERIHQVEVVGAPPVLVLYPVPPAAQ